jgi:DNA-binding response OmpR family regulator
MGVRRILIVDDEAPLLTLNKAIVGRAFPESDIVTAITAEGALSHMMAERFDLILSDLETPGNATGNDVAAQARLDKTPCVIATGKPDLVEPGIASDVVSKPYSRRELVAALNGALRRFHSVLGINDLDTNPTRSAVQVPPN